MTMVTIDAQNNKEQEEVKTVDFNVWPKGKYNADYAQYDLLK